MKTLKFICSIALLSIICGACETPMTDIPRSELPQAESKLVVSSIISPQLPFINVVVTESIPLFTDTESTGSRVENATVRLSDGVNEILIPFNAEKKLYSIPQSKFPISGSKTYYLTVSDKSRNVTAQCSVPGKTPVIKSYKLDTVVVDDITTKDTILTLQMNWQDIPSDTNYYKLSAGFDIEYSIGFVKDQQVKESRISNHFYFHWDWQKGKNEYFIDHNLDGAIMNSPLAKITLPRPSENILANGKKVTVYPKIKIPEIIIEVLNLDTNYHKYQRSLEVKSNSDTPFAEPAPLYSNVNGGLGCFAAYNAAQVKVVF
ncbi:DUF4249 domain-containing protein [Dyadobacter sp. CY351]|uniref:DUF4249 domain-containing protein n=1 Tax=Dyadobacter sp. CY351 TaxID=2909337 RepID=UPI001F429321|nr:DUF4249 domain-containing protein [Dyadobacter sp. CY351]MCF2516070.1 DUF4249 domain-containing protein [Dyadobacter sp. CY351]